LSPVTAKRAGLLLDLDGTLADSLPVMRISYDRLLARFGCIGSDAEFELLNGPPLTTVADHLIRHHGLDCTVQTLLETYRELIHGAYMQVAPSHGARPLLEALQHDRVCTAVVTSNTSALTRAWLEHTGLSGLIDVIVGCEDVTHGKPDPEPYTVALDRLRAAPERSFAVEDTLTGARSALAAGLRTAVIGFPQDALPEGMMAVQSLADVAAVIRSDAKGNIGS
jgi:HAD superfamily hydrolase (TIGR01509 family)